MKHLSVRVAWHDNIWNGGICRKPSENSYCRLLTKIAEANKCNDNNNACKLWKDLPVAQLPPCLGENGGFMNPQKFQRFFNHVYQKNGGRHSVLRTTHVDFPPFSASGIPFRYLSKDNQEWMNKMVPDLHDDVDPGFNTAWIYGEERQTDILTWFRRNLHNNESLCVFYSKNGNPVDDEGRRMIVGIGEITNIHPLYKYDSSASYTYPLWEVVFEHSIRPDLSDSKGFLVPYHSYLSLDEEYILNKTGLSKTEALNEIKLSIDKFGNNNQIIDELSYVCDHISNHSMLLILSTARQSVEAIIRHGLIGGNWEDQLKWIDSKIGEIKAKIGPFPAFAEALKAIGFDYSYLIEEDIRKMGCDIKDNPWEYLNGMLCGKQGIPEVAYIKYFNTYKELWNSLPKDSKELLILLSRFDISSEIIEKYIHDTDSYAKIIANPYLISEGCVKNYEYSVPSSIIDFGVMVDAEIQGENIPDSPAAVETPLDERRLRAILIEHLWRLAEEEGHTIISIKDSEEFLRNYLHEEDNTRLPINLILTKRNFFSSEIAYLPENDPKDIQLKGYYRMENKLESILLKRAKKDVSNPSNEDWLKVIQSSKFYNPSSPISVEAAKQQLAALEIMDHKRLSVLSGGAGTGKTAVVSFFLSSQTILNEGVLLLAPTGKARVRLSAQAGGDNRIKALTIAQFLIRHNRYDGKYFHPVSNCNAEQYSEAQNIIIDECSMLTVNDLYVLFEALDMKRVKRIILIGDPSQLPPIGPGRPFADFCNLIRYNSDNNKYSSLKDSLAELKTVVRTVNGEESDILSLAAWFSHDKPAKDSVNIFDKIESNSLNKDLEMVCWENAEDLTEKLKQVLCRELNCNGDNLRLTLRKCLGLDNLDKLKENAAALDNLQILTPVRNNPWGVYLLNQTIQKWIHTGLDVPSVQISNQIILEGDKVMQLRNEKRLAYPSKRTYQLSNGQIGFIYSVNKSSNHPCCNVNFNGLPIQTFGYMPMKGDEGEPPIEMAYAISIHKSQGSDFNTVLVVLPKSGKNISRELIYTALTRAKEKVILLLEDNLNWLYAKSKPEASILGARRTNLFKYSVEPEFKENQYRTEGLIHRTKPDSNNQVIAVRSKSEVIIANEIISAGIPFKYEEPLDKNKGKYLLPDFTFVDDSGEIIIWEHLGMLGLPAYREAWERKLKRYHEMGFEEGETLFITKDNLDGSFNTEEVMDVIKEIKKLMI